MMGTHPNGVELKVVEHPRAKAIRVALNRVRHCPTAIVDGEVVVVNPATEEDQLDYPEEKEGKITTDDEHNEEKEGEITTDDEHNEEKEGEIMTDNKHSERQSNWKTRLRPCSPRTAAS